MSYVLWFYWTLLAVLLVPITHRLLIFLLYCTVRQEGLREPECSFELPQVTVQLPIYNEAGVVERLLNAVCSLRYPKELLQVQVLDDSDDETATILAGLVARWRQSGVNIEHLRRGMRYGYKPGALNEGLSAATGDVIAIFDADFVPAPEFLARTVHYFRDHSVAAVQTRWGHLNHTVSWLTRLQAVLLDAQFEVEHRVRRRFPLLYHTNGSGVLWRKQAIQALGGWPQRNSAEDLDLAYLAQLAGWKCLFTEDVVCAGELPETMADWISQQIKWAYLGTRSAAFLLPRLWGSRLPVWTKLDSTLELTARWTPLLVLMLVALWLPAAVQADFAKRTTLWLIATGFLIGWTQICVWTYFWVSQNGLGHHWMRRVALVFCVSVLGIGLSVPVAKGSLRGFLARGGAVPRTRKGRDVRRHSAHEKGVLSDVHLVVLLQGVLAVYLGLSIIMAPTMKVLHAVPFMALGAAGFVWFGGCTLRESLRSRRKRG